MRRVLSLGIVVVASVASPAFAQPWQDEEPAAVLSDVVKLKDGSIFRGVITEKVVGEYVTILLPGGKTREVDWGDVEYAGAWKPLPSDASGDGHDDDDEARFEFRGAAEPTPEHDGGGLSLYLDAGVTVARATAIGSHGGFVSYEAVTHGFDRVCTAPCDASLPAGTYEFALSGPGRYRPTAVHGQITLPAGESRLEGRFESQAMTRGWGWVIFGTGIVGGFGLMVAAVDEQCVRVQL